MIPARLRSTRLPDKPLAEIGGVPMIVQVWRRACAAEVGPVVVACAEREIADAVEAHGGTAVLTDPELPSGTDRIFQALSELDPERPLRARDQPAGRSADARSGARSGRCSSRSSASAPTSARWRWRPRIRRRRDDPNVVKAVIAFDPPAPAARPRALFHAGDRAERRRPGLPPHRHLRLSPRRPGALRRRCRPVRSSSASASSSCARSRPA